MKMSENMKEEVQALMEDILAGKISVADARGITDEELESAYALGYSFYGVGDWEKAETVFRFLTMMSHLDVKYWMALGAARQAKKDWQGALKVYAHVCVNLDSRNVKASLRAAECYLRLGDRKNAASALQHVRRFADPATDEGMEALKAAAALIEE